MSGTARWGPSLWKSLNAIIRNYPETPNDEHRDQYKTFIISLGHVLPCPKCRSHYNEYMSSVIWDEILVNKKTIELFLITFHNDVNKRLGKQILDIPTATSIIYDEQTKFPDYLPVIGISTFISILVIWLILIKTERR